MLVLPAVAVMVMVLQVQVIAQTETMLSVATIAIPTIAKAFFLENVYFSPPFEPEGKSCSGKTTEDSYRKVLWRFFLDKTGLMSMFFI
jgi:hypothetical protein